MFKPTKAQILSAVTIGFTSVAIFWASIHTEERIERERISGDKNYSINKESSDPVLKPVRGKIDTPTELQDAANKVNWDDGNERTFEQLMRCQIERVYRPNQPADPVLEQRLQEELTSIQESYRSLDDQKQSLYEELRDVNNYLGFGEGGVVFILSPDHPDLSEGFNPIKRREELLDEIDRIEEKSEKLSTGPSASVHEQLLENKHHVASYACYEGYVTTRSTLGVEVCDLIFLQHIYKSNRFNYKTSRCRWIE
ncbi:hypothetical protein [Synechococcus sp. UW69]|uniref:hypothetical protein n=1 Tax=Synechococcus sp. UW69 TaxID=368493 RepID=UPI0010BDDEC3|nr:hypothetical protein [Synechococcus sp. UW69]